MRKLLAVMALTLCSAATAQTDTVLTKATATAQTDTVLTKAAATAQTDTELTKDGAPAQTSTEPTPACVAGPFMVFFDRDSDVLTPQAAAILENAAQAYLTCGQAQVQISGHTDRRGDDGFNVGLSQRIAASVRSYLVQRGIPDGVVTTEAFGESRPLVETADGVSEPQNRRAEITFGPGSGW
jgi:outer membrane protein OmpA-like peptidoglycan-associated protein